MTTPQPSNQLPEEVKRAASKEVFCRMTPNPCDFPNCVCDMREFPPMHFAPRPPAPAEETHVLEIHERAQNMTMAQRQRLDHLRSQPAPMDAEWAKQRIKELELCLHGLLGLEGKDTSAPKLKCYFDSARQLLTNIK